MFSRYRSYTCYSEENGKLVPSIEPMVTQSTTEKEQQKSTDSTLKQQQLKEVKQVDPNQPSQIIGTS